MEHRKTDSQIHNTPTIPSIEQHQRCCSLVQQQEVSCHQPVRMVVSRKWVWTKETQTHTIQPPQTLHFLLVGWLPLHTETSASPHFHKQPWCAMACLMCAKRKKNKKNELMLKPTVNENINNNILTMPHTHKTSNLLFHIHRNTTCNKIFDEKLFLLHIFCWNRWEKCIFPKLQNTK